MRRTTFEWLLLTQALLQLGCAGRASPPARLAGLCFMARDRAEVSRPVRPHEWLKLLVKLDLGSRAVVALRDCTGRLIAPQATGAHGCATTRANDIPEALAIGQQSLIERVISGHERLLWIVSHRFPNGDGFGPLALARHVADGIEVTALGNLRLRTQRVHLELWRVQHETVVVASGESCAHSHDVHDVHDAHDVRNARGCGRVLQLMVQRMNALLDAPLLDGAGRCVQALPIELSHSRQEPLASGLRRSYELNSAVSHDARHIVLEERLLVLDTDPNLPAQAPREVQRIEAHRFVRIVGGRLVSQQHPLWNRVLAELSKPTEPTNAR